MATKRESRITVQVGRDSDIIRTAFQSISDTVPILRDGLVD
jgi:hypothetical protein